MGETLPTRQRAERKGATMEALPISRKPHALLRGRMKERDVDNKYLCKKWGQAASTVSHKMTGKVAWSIWEIWDLTNMLGLEPERMHEYFPDYRKKK